MFWEVFLKNFLAILDKVLIFKVFRVESFFKVFFWKSGAWDLWGILGVFCSGCLSLGFPLEFRYFSVLPPMILRYFFDHSSIDLRFPNGGWTENERRINGGSTEVERRSNGAWTEPERRLNGGWTEVERSSNGARTEVERRLNGGWTELERRLNGARTEVERSSNGGWTELKRRTIRKICHRNCWADCDTVSYPWWVLCRVLMIF